MEQKNIKKTGFTLVELAIVILIIGVLLVAVSSSKSLINKTKLTSARSLTNNSPVHQISDLQLWIETTLEKSIIPQTDGNLPASNAGLIKNINTQLGGVNPTYTDTINFDTDGLDGILPVLTISSATNATIGVPTLIESNLIGKAFTIIMVDHTTVLDASSSIMTFTDSATTPNTLNIGYDASSQFILTGVTSGSAMTFTQQGTALLPSVARPTIHNVVVDSTVGQYYAQGSAVNSAAFTHSGMVEGAVTVTVGDGSDYDGNILEVMIFNRALTNDELNKINRYLSKKFGISGIAAI